ncbi:MAG: DHA2 family efflux MFS transporter permease subunit [Polyangiales bacterium]
MAAAAISAPRPIEIDKARRWLILFTASLGALLEVIDTSIVNVALTDIQASLGATLSEVGWVITSYAIANVIILPMSAWLGHRFGKKRYFIFAMVAFTGASVLCGVATSLPMLIFARILQGLGGGGLLAKAQSILFETFPKEEQATAQGVFGICVIAGPAIGPTLGGWLTTNFDWRWIFFINLPVGIAATFMAVAILVDDAPDERAAAGTPVDWLGILLLAVSVGSLQTVLEEGGSEDWFDSRMITVLAITGAISIVTFVWWQLRIDHPVVDLRVLKHRSLAGGAALSLVTGMAMYGALFAVPIFAQSILGLTASQTGWMLLPGALASAFMMPIVGKLPGDARVKILGGGAVLLFAMLWLARLTPTWGDDQLFWPLLIRGAGTVMIYMPLTLATIGPIPKKDIAAATGFYSLTRQLGGSLGIAVLTWVLEHRIAFHHAVLSEKLAMGAPAVTERLNVLTGVYVGRGVEATRAGALALKALNTSMTHQADVLAYADTFWFVGALLVLASPFVMLLGSGKGLKAATDAH